MIWEYMTEEMLEELGNEYRYIWKKNDEIYKMFQDKSFIYMPEYDRIQLVKIYCAQNLYLDLLANRLEFHEVEFSNLERVKIGWSIKDE